ncbi:MAG: M23 family metallopeptidase [Spirochaetales bacterium]|nr:M23 family metallopeptidase [Spirochaetales bacterium]
MNRFRNLFVAFTLCCVSVSWVFPDIRSRDECVPGGYLTVTVTGFDPSDVALVQLVDDCGEVSSQNVLFPLPDGAENEFCTVIGVPESLREGTYIVAVIGEDGSLTEARVVAAVGREFRSETIRLNESMSELRRTENEQRIREAEQLRELINRRNVDALHHFGPFSFPVEEAISTSYFGDRRLFVYADDRADRSVHTGIDLAAPVGTPVRSSGKGVVVFAGDRLISGNTVVVEHLPGVFTLYYHLDRIDVKQGQYLTEDSILGTVGCTGLATGPHLHWEFRIGGVGVDPEIMIEFGF